MRKILILCGVFTLSACTPTQIHQFRNAVLCNRAGMTNCVETVDKNGNGSLSGDKCVEDMECFDCNVMGNGICGPVTLYLPTKSLHAANGDFEFTKIILKKGNMACVKGHRVIPPFDITPLACARTDI